MLRVAITVQRNSSQQWRTTEATESQEICTKVKWKSHSFETMTSDGLMLPVSAQSREDVTPDHVRETPRKWAKHIGKLRFSNIDDFALNVIRSIVRSFHQQMIMPTAHMMYERMIDQTRRTRDGFTYNRIWLHQIMTSSGIQEHDCQ